jgi:hypothetical protein
MVRYHRSLNHKLCQLGIGGCFLTPSAPYEKSKSLGSGGSIVARLKLKEMTEEHHQEWNLQLNLTQHGKTYQVQT